MPNADRPLVGIIMGSESDWEPVMRHASATLTALGIAHEKRVTSAHRTPAAVEEYARTARPRGIKVMIAGAGGAAHLPGMAKAQTDSLPVIGVPVPGAGLDGLDALLSIVQMPPGVPVATMAIGKAGAINAAILAAEILALSDDALLERLREYRRGLEGNVAAMDAAVTAA